MSPVSISRTAAAARTQTAATDRAAVLVQLAAPRGKRTSLGTAEEALNDTRLTASERAAILSLVEAVRLLRERAALVGVDDAGRAVTLLLRDSEATDRGPWATTNQIAVGTRNGLATRAGGRARADVLITVDAAVHELAHVVQFARMPAKATPHAAILEGIADSVAILATGDDTLGEEFYKRDANGRYRGAIRELGARTITGPAIGSVISNYHDAVRPGTEEHAGGGVVSATFIALRDRIGRARAEELLWAVIRDPQAWQRGGSWRELAESIQRQAATRWATDPALRAAVNAALAVTKLDAAIPA